MMNIDEKPLFSFTFEVDGKSYHFNVEAQSQDGAMGTLESHLVKMLDELRATKSE